MKTERLVRAIWPTVLGAVLGAIFVPWVVSYWWPAKTISVKQRNPTPNLQITEVTVELPPQLRIAQAVGPVVGGTRGLLSAIAARRAGGRV